MARLSFHVALVVGSLPKRSSASTATVASGENLYVAAIEPAASGWLKPRKFCFAVDQIFCGSADWSRMLAPKLNCGVAVQPTCDIQANCVCGVAPVDAVPVGTYANGEL